MLIANGSSVSQMREQFLTGSAPLFGRKTFLLKVKPLGFFQMADFFQNKEAVPYIYGVYGGTPKYFAGYDETKSLKQNVMRDLLQTGAALLEEPEDVLRREIRDPSSYNAAFTAIASGAAKYSEISSRADLESGNVSGHIKTLELLDLVGKEVPQGDATKNKTQYKITDNFFGFWYRFIPRNLSLIASGHPEIAYRYIEENLDKYMGPVFEQICLEWLWRHNGTNDLPLVFTDAGRWWGGNPLTKRESEVDIVAHNDTGKALLCECKWSINPVGIDVLEHLEDIAEIPHFQKYSTKSFCLFSRSGFTAACLDVAAARSDVFLVSLEDMLAR